MTSYKTTRSVAPVRSEEDLRQLERQNYSDLIPSSSLYEVLRATAALHGDRPALTVLNSPEPGPSDRTYSHSQLFREVTRTANTFTALGVGPTDIVAILSRTYLDVPAAIWAAETAGIASCINYLLSAEVIVSLLSSEGARVLVCPGPDLDEELWQKTTRIAAEATFLEHILVLGKVPEGADSRFRELDSARAGQPDERLNRVGEPSKNDIAALFHTGGTTGIPKLVPQTHRNQIHAAWSFAQLFDLTENDVSLNGFPLFHVGGTSTMGLSVLAAGGHVVMLTPAGFRDPAVIANIWNYVQRFRATVLGAVPTSIGAMSDTPVGNADISTLRFVLSGGAPLPRATADRFEKRASAPLVEQYGMTETNAAISITPLHGAHKRGSVGVRCPFSQIRILRMEADGQARDCAAGEIGQIICAGPQVVPGYLDDKHTADGFLADGSLITGDMGYLDDDGYLYITGREKDLIIRSGHNIDPQSIEEVVDSHAAVSASAAVSMPDEYAGEVPVVFVCPAAGETVDPEELGRYINERIHEPPARPRHVFVLDALPVTGVGKIFKPELREIAIHRKLESLISDNGWSMEITGVSTEPGSSGAYLIKVRPISQDENLEAKGLLEQSLARLPIKTTLIIE